VDAPVGLRVGGFVPFSATDFPDALAAVVFCQGCPWRCAYCHNPHLVASDGPESHDWAAIVRWLDTRKGLLDAVVFSGGEPTAQGALGIAMDAVRALGFEVGLHTGGAYPRRLAEVLPHAGWIGLDVKAPPSGYAAVTGARGSASAAFASLDLVLAAGKPYEVRTTVHPSVTSTDALERLAGNLASRGVTRWVLQPFRPTGCAHPDLVAAAPHGVTMDDALLARLAAHVPVIEVRG
jgi:pyruvate formate lyase activating enzyme